MSQPPPAPATTLPAPPLPPWAEDLEDHALVPFLSFIEQMAREKMSFTDSNYLHNMATATEKLAHMLRGGLQISANEIYEVSEHDQEHILNITYPIRERMAVLGANILKRAYAHDVAAHGGRRVSHETYLETLVYLGATMFMKKDCSMVKFIQASVDSTSQYYKKRYDAQTRTYDYGRESVCIKLMEYLAGKRHCYLDEAYFV